MTRTPRVQREVDALAAKYPGATAFEEETDGSLTLVIPYYPIPVGVFDRDAVSIAVKVGPLYPAEKLDLFWLDPSLRHRDNVALPNLMSPSVTLANQSWAQISWHDNAPHDPQRMTILGFVHSIGDWFAGQAVQTGGGG